MRRNTAMVVTSRRDGGKGADERLLLCQRVADLIERMILSLPRGAERFIVLDRRPAINRQKALLVTFALALKQFSAEKSSATAKKARPVAVGAIRLTERRFPLTAHAKPPHQRVHCRSPYPCGNRKICRIAEPFAPALA